MWVCWFKGASPGGKLYMAPLKDMIGVAGQNKYWWRGNATRCPHQSFYAAGRDHHVWIENASLIQNQRRRDSRDDRV